MPQEACPFGAQVPYGRWPTKLVYSMEMDRLRKRTHGLVFKTKMGQKTVKKVKIGQIGQIRVKIGSKWPT